MANNLITAAWECSLPRGNPVAMLVLVRLADAARNALDDECWLSQERLARDCRISLRSVQNALERLTADGHVTLRKNSRRDMDNRANVYRVHPQLDARGAPNSDENTHVVHVSDGELPLEIHARGAEIHARGAEIHARGARRTSTNPKEPTLGSVEPEEAPVFAFDTTTHPTASAPARKKTPAPTPASAKKGRPRDLAFEALARIEGAAVDAATGHVSGIGSQERGRINGALRDIRTASPGLDPAALAAEMGVRARQWDRLFPGAKLTAKALSGHWAKLQVHAPSGAAAAAGGASPWALPAGCDWRGIARQLGLRISPDTPWAEVGRADKVSILQRHKDNA